MDRLKGCSPLSKCVSCDSSREAAGESDVVLAFFWKQTGGQFERREPPLPGGGASLSAVDKKKGKKGQG